MADENQKMVVYTGGATERTISDEEFATVGVDGQKSVSWDPTNFHQVPVSEFTEKALQLIRQSPREWRIDGEHQPGNAPIPDTEPHGEQIIMPPRTGEDDTVGRDPAPASTGTKKKEENR